MLPDSVQLALMPKDGAAGSEDETAPGDCAGAAGAEATSPVRDTRVQGNSGLPAQNQSDVAHPCTPTQSETVDPKLFNEMWTQAEIEYSQAETVPAG